MEKGIKNRRKQTRARNARSLAETTHGGKGEIKERRSYRMHVFGIPIPMPHIDVPVAVKSAATKIERRVPSTELVRKAMDEMIERKEKEKERYM